MQLTQLKDTLSQKEQELPNIYELQRELENYDERIKTLNEISNQKELTIKHLQQSYKWRKCNKEIPYSCRSC
jgi:hypothetical protein